MAFIGEILKRIVEFADKVNTNTNPAEAQKGTLKQLLEKADNTAFGKFYQFKKMLSYEGDLRNALLRRFPITPMIACISNGGIKLLKERRILPGP
ncbi:MAG: hypothetical protein ACOC4J_01845, partial [Bacteroidota bacterium]